MFAKTINPRNILYLSLLLVVIFGGTVLGAIPFLIGLSVALISRLNKYSFIVSASIVTLLFLTSWLHQGISGIFFQINMHDAYSFNGKSPLLINYLCSLFFTYFGVQLAGSISRFKNRIYSL